LVLVILAEGPNHGYGLIKAVEQQSNSGVLLDPANLYRMARRLREAGWIVETESSEHSTRRRTYAITGRGRRILSEEVERLETLLSRARPALARGEGR